MRYDCEIYCGSDPAAMGKALLEWLVRQHRPVKRAVVESSGIIGLKTGMRSRLVAARRLSFAMYGNPGGAFLCKPLHECSPLEYSAGASDMYLHGGTLIIRNTPGAVIDTLKTARRNRAHYLVNVLMYEKRFSVKDDYLMLPAYRLVTTGMTCDDTDLLHAAVSLHVVTRRGRCYEECKALKGRIR